MTKEKIRRRSEANPFVPFKARVETEGNFDVPSRGHAHLHHTRPAMRILIAEGGAEIVNVAVVSSRLMKEAA